MGKALILNYNRIVSGGEALRTEINSAIPKTSFVEQLDCIQKKGIPIVAMADWAEDKVLHDFVVILTFDNGYESDYEDVLPLLEERNISGTFFPVLSNVDGKKRLNWSQLREISACGCEIGSHGVFHKNMAQSKIEVCKLELEVSKRILEQKLGNAVRSFAAPFGIYNRRVLKLASQAGYEKVFSNRLKMNLDHHAFIQHRWNISRQISIQTFEKTLRKGAVLYRDYGFFSKIKNQVSRRLEVGLMDGANELLLKLDKYSF